MPTKSFADPDKDTKQFWDTGKSQGMPPANLRKVAKRKLLMPHSAIGLADLRVPPGNQSASLYSRIGKVSTAFASTTSFVCFVWRDGDASEVEIADYH